MREVAIEEREGLGLEPGDRFDPYALAEEHGIGVYTLTDLREWDLSDDAFTHFHTDTRGTWSAALVPLGTARIIIDNDGHAEVRRRASIAHELGHHLLEHEFDSALTGGDHKRMFDPAKEKQATFVASELLIPDSEAYRAARARWSNATVAETFGVSPQYAQMRMAGARVVAQRVSAKYRR